MTVKVLLLLTLSAALFQLAHCSSVLRFRGFEAGCPYSPSEWCSSEEIAASCGVLHQCKAHLKQHHESAAPVNVTLYMESLCPDCKAFFKKQFYPTWQKLNSSGIMNIDVVPYGNAQEQINQHRWIFTCQHGPAECEGNQIETCAMGILRSPARWMPYFACLEEKMTEGNIVPAAQQCAKSQNVSYEHIHVCAHNEWGDMLQHHMAERTDKLKPKHTYVPWVTINGVHSEEIQKQAESDLLSLVCSTYKGTKPKACEKSVASRCYKP